MGEKWGTCMDVERSTAIGHENNSILLSALALSLESEAADTHHCPGAGRHTPNWYSQWQPLFLRLLSRA